MGDRQTTLEQVREFQRAISELEAEQALRRLQLAALHSQLDSLLCELGGDK